MGDNQMKISDSTKTNEKQCTRKTVRFGYLSVCRCSTTHDVIWNVHFVHIYAIYCHLNNLINEIVWFIQNLYIWIVRIQSG